jgi:hypothetical protein
LTVADESVDGVEAEPPPAHDDRLSFLSSDPRRVSEFESLAFDKLAPEAALRRNCSKLLALDLRSRLLEAVDSTSEPESAIAAVSLPLMMF